MIDEAHDHAAEALETAIALFRAERTGELAFDEHVRPIRFVTDNETGHIVAPVMVAVLQCFEAVLHVPEESDDALQLLLTPEAMDGESHAAADRWRIHHGEPQESRWARFHIESARHGPYVFDGAVFMGPNPVAGVEAALCRRLNEDPDLLGKVCERAAHFSIASPVCVGLDPDGVHVRARFGVVRVEFPHRAHGAHDAERLVEELLKDAGGS